MEFLHRHENLNRGDIVELSCDTQCNFMLLSDTDFWSYKSGRSFHYIGGQTRLVRTRLAAPHSGSWHVVVDLGGGSGMLRHSLRIIPARASLGSVY